MRIEKCTVIRVVWIFILLGTALTTNSYAQWDTSVAGKITTNDNVGIGTTTPGATLDVSGMDVNGLKITTTKTGAGDLIGAQYTFTDTSSSGGLSGLSIDYTHNGSVKTNHVAASTTMTLKGSGSASSDVGKIGHAYYLNFTGATGPGYSYTHDNAYAFALRASIFTLGERTHFIKNIGGLQILHQYDNSSRTLSATNLYGIIVGDISQYGSNGLNVVTNAGGILINKQRDILANSVTPGGRITNLQGLWLNGDGVGADVVLGANKETKLYGSSGNFIIDTSGNVGIGTTNPNAKLESLSDSNGVITEALRLSNNGVGAGTGIKLTFSNIIPQATIKSYYDGMWKMGLAADVTGDAITITNSGNVGIGTTSPGAKLQIISPDNNYPTSAVPSLSIRQVGNNAYGWDWIQDDDNTGDIYFHRVENDVSTGVMSFGRSTGNVGIGTTTPEQKLDVAGNIKGDALCIGPDCRTSWPVSQNASGNVGIGTSTPVSKLHVKAGDAGGNPSGSQEHIVIESNENAYIALVVPKTSQSGISFSSDTDNARGGIYYGQRSYGNEPDAMKFRTADVERMRIDQSGNVGIGTTNPDEKLQVYGNAHVTGKLRVDGNIAAKYQDLAEWVLTSEFLARGTVVMIDTKEVNEVVSSDRPYNTLVAGVVSESPGIILGEEGSDKAIIAHTGRVKVKVDTSYGAISVGDLLVTSPAKGYAMKADSDKLKPGMLLGKALEPLKEGQQGEILVLITLQ